MFFFIQACFGIIYTKNLFQGFFIISRNFQHTYLAYFITNEYNLSSSGQNTCLVELGR